MNRMHSAAMVWNIKLAADKREMNRMHSAAMVWNIKLAADKREMNRAHSAAAVWDIEIESAVQAHLAPTAQRTIRVIPRTSAAKCFELNYDWPRIYAE